MSMFEQATRKAIRFDSIRGPLTVEDLWSLPLTSPAGKVNLDDTAKGLRKLLKNDEEESFVIKSTPKKSDTQLKFDIVKYIIEVKMAEAAAQQLAASKRDRNQKIMALIEQKQDSELAAKSTEELRALLAEDAAS